MRWNKYTINTTTEAEDFISMMLVELGITQVQIEDKVPLTAADQAAMFIDFLPDLGPDDGKSQVSFYTEEGGDDTELLEQVKEGIEEQRMFVEVGEGSIEKSMTEDLDWQNNWKEFFHPFSIDNILIKPTWEEIPDGDEGKILIEIDPGVSFGTGQHETTRLCIQQLQKHLKEGQRVLDLGCGSGILSIAALKLGAGEINGTDIDEDCITSTFENMEVNNLKDKMGNFKVGNIIDDTNLQKEMGGDYDIVVANILADVIIPMCPVIPDRLKAGGLFITSGIIDFKENEVKEAMEKAGLTVLEVNHDGEWVNITCSKSL